MKRFLINTAIAVWIVLQIPAAIVGGFIYLFRIEIMRDIGITIAIYPLVGLLHLNNKIQDSTYFSEVRSRTI